ncbi:MAG: SRPBCC family protein [Actinobacteria bacterium]|nr:MAG: SRPBCC family protein [Actinomycetota bacterium]
MSTPLPSTDRLGTLSETSDGWQLRFVRHLDRPPSVVWRAFTDPELRSKWFPDTMVGDLVVGNSLEFRHEGMDIQPFRGEVLEVVEPNRLVFTWGDDLLRFEFAESGSGTELTMTVGFTEQGKAARDGAGWHECLDNLVKLLASDPERVEADTWATIHPAYVERFGPAASTIGPPQEYLDAQQG